MSRAQCEGSAGRLRNPEGWATIPVEVVTDGKRLILIGEPPEGEDAGHDCDVMGCGLTHVLAIVWLSHEARRGLAHLVAAGDAPPGDSPRREPTLRETVLARIGRVKDGWEGGGL